MAGERVTGAPPARAASLSASLARVPAATWTLVAAGLVLVSVLVRILIARRMPGPWIMSDEITYSELARSFADKHRMLFHGRPRPFQSIYPVLISPAYAVDSLPTAYGIVKSLNVVLMSLAAIPFWLWSRRLMPAAHALAALTLFLLLPAFVYTNEVMTESAALPAIVLALFAIAWAFERPTPMRQLLVVAAVGLACLVRLQALVLFAGLPTAVVLKGILDARATATSVRDGIVTAVRRFAWGLGVVVAVGLASAGLKAAQGSSVSALLGAYEGTQSGYSLAAVARWLVFHLAELPYTVALVPASAFIVLAGLALRRGAVTTQAERAFLAVTAGVAPWMILQVAAFASQFSFRIEERNMIYLGPLLLLALMLWIAQGLPRPPVLAGAAALVPAVLLVSLPLENLLNISIRSDTFSFSPLLRLLTRFDGGIYDVRITLALAAAAAALAFLALPRHIATFVLPLGVGVFLVVCSHSAFGGARGLALGARAAPGAADVNWVDDRLGTDANAVFVNDQPDSGNTALLWQTEFWNRSVHPLLNIAPPHDVLGESATLDPATGKISATVPDVANEAAAADYAVAPKTLKLLGRPVAEVGQLALYRLERPLRIASSTTGIYTDGWTGQAASLTQYAVPGGGPANVVVELRLPKVAGQGFAEQVTVTVGNRQRVVSVPQGTSRVVRMPAPRAPFSVNLGVSPGFSPAELGSSADTRLLGVLAAIDVVPR